MRKLFRFLFYPIVLVALALAVTEAIPTVTWLVKHLEAYQWFFIGMGSYLIIRILPFIRRNEEWLQTFSHELTHTIVSIMFLQKIVSFQAGEGTGVVWRRGGRFGDMFIGLAPYCLPIFTYAIIFFRIIGASHMLHIFDIFIGFTLAFHIICFWKQTGGYQTDIQEQGYFRSFLFISTALIFNLTVILLSIRKGIVNTVTYLFPEYWHDLVKWWNYASDMVMGWIA